MRLLPRRRWLRVVAVLIGVWVVYVGVTFAQVWSAARDDDRGPAGAIVVLGAAQYDGEPSPVLASRLEHAFALWRDGVAPLIVVTGGRQPGDRFTEATAGAGFLHDLGVPDSAIRREVGGQSSYESIVATSRFLRREGVTSVVLVSDPFHSYRIEAIAEETGLTASVSPVPDSLISGGQELRAMLRETGAVSVGRIIGYRRLARVLSWL